MSLILTYKNERGSVVMQGDSLSDLRITEIEGLGPVTREYNSAIYSGYDGQETLNFRAIPRSITVSIEVVSRKLSEKIRDVLEVLSVSGMMYIEEEDLSRRIYCNQVQIPDIKRVIKGQIASFAVQFVCDNPYFEDAEDMVVPLYKREKLLKTPFLLPNMFGQIVLGNSIEVRGSISVEPIVAICYPSSFEGAESIILTNETTGKRVCLDYAPVAGETVTIDIKNRKILSSIRGNIINYLSNDTFLGDFVLVRGQNVLSVDVGDVTSNFTIDCKYNNLYSEAVIV